MSKRSMKIVLFYSGNQFVVKRRIRIFRDLLNGKHGEVVIQTSNKHALTGPFGSAISDLLMSFKTLLAKPDVVHIFDFSPSMSLLTKVSRLLKTTFIYDTGNIHGEVARTEGKHKIAIQIIKFLERKLIISSTRIITRGISLKKYIDDEFSRNSTLIYDPVNIVEFKKANEKSVRRDLGISEDLMLIGYVSNIGLINLFEDSKTPRGWELPFVIESLIRKQVIAKVLIIGVGNGLYRLREIVHSMQLDDYFIFTGYVKEAEYPSFLKAIDIGFMEDYKSLQYSTSTGAKVQDYMSAGKPVVTGNNLDRAFLLAYQDACKLLFNPPRVDSVGAKESYINSISQIIEEIKADIEHTRECGLSNLKRAEELFDLKVTETRLSETYEKLKTR